MATDLGSYRGYLQGMANAGNMDALALLQVVGDDYGVDQTFLDKGVSTTVNGVDYSVNDIVGLNDTYKGAYQQAVGLTTGNEENVLDTTDTGTGSTIYSDLAYLQDQEDQLRNLLGQSDQYEQQGLTNLQDSYNLSVGRANEDQSARLSGFATQKEDQQRDRQTARRGVDTNVRTLNDSLRRILGLASGRNSSAYQLAAPSAVARLGNTERLGVNETYGRNLRDIDTAKAGAEVAFGRTLDDLLSDKNTKESDLRAGILQQKQGINADLAEVARQRALLQGGDYTAVQAAQSPFQQNIQAADQALLNLFEQFRTPAFNPQPVQVQTPELAKYSTERFGIGPVQGGQQGEYDTPYAAFLRRQREREA